MTGSPAPEIFSLKNPRIDASMRGMYFSLNALKLEDGEGGRFMAFIVPFGKTMCQSDFGALSGEGENNARKSRTERKYILVKFSVEKNLLPAYSLTRGGDMEKLYLSKDILYKALLEKDPQFEGQFYAGIKTTGIFCRPTCRARKPKRENVEYFATAKEALSKGYRPCKICRPLENASEIPADIRSLLRELEMHPDVKISDSSLARKGFQPSRIRRWFIKNHGMTFHAYQRLLRINNALMIMKNGERVAEAAFESGYESLSGFQYSFSKATSKSPRESKTIDCLVFSRFTTPLGPMIAVGNDRGIFLLEFTDRKALVKELQLLRSFFKLNIFPGTNENIEKLKEQVKEYFIGTRKDFDVPLAPQGTEFQKKIWGLLKHIPFGTTKAYRDIAALSGNPKALRAVGRAIGSNRISIIIPCHRVTGADGQITGYGGGIWRKRWLLRHENKGGE
jgi:AraC family transcriptional regulator of adaptative response/methylated-DNA-[protein]-cysteine methyltransferase